MGVYPILSFHTASYRASFLFHSRYTSFEATHVVGTIQVQAYNHKAFFLDRVFLFLVKVGQLREESQSLFLVEFDYESNLLVG